MYLPNDSDTYLSFNSVPEPPKKKLKKEKDLLNHLKGKKMGG